jgi:hypothetical protein
MLIGLTVRNKTKREREGELHESHNESDIGIDIGL